MKYLIRSIFSYSYFILICHSGINFKNISTHIDSQVNYKYKMCHFLID